MFAFPEQFSNATKANLESQFALFSALTSKTFEGVEKLVDLNINTVKAALEDSSATARQLRLVASRFRPDPAIRGLASRRRVPALCCLLSWLRKRARTEFRRRQPHPTKSSSRYRPAGTDAA